MWYGVNSLRTMMLTALWSSTPVRAAEVPAQTPGTPALYRQVVLGLTYRAHSRDGLPKSTLDVKDGMLRIDQGDLLFIRFAFRKDRFSRWKDMLPEAVCVTAIPVPDVSTAGGSAEPAQPATSAGSRVPVPTAKQLLLSDSDQEQSVVDALELSTRRTIVQFVFRPSTPSCTTEGPPIQTETVLVFLSEKGFAPKLTDALLLLGRTRLPPVADTAVPNSPNRQVFVGRVGANLFPWGEGSGWLLGNLAMNVAAVDFDGTNRPGLGLAFAVPGTRRGLFVGWGYNFSTNLHDKDYVFVGTSFMGLKTLLDPRGKLFGGP